MGEEDALPNHQEAEALLEHRTLAETLSREEDVPVTHTGPVPESSGKLSAWRLSPQRCRGECNEVTEHECWTWESDCGGYEDYKFKCTVCKNVFWIDGDDG